jgi:hypothetical protein
VVRIPPGAWLFVSCECCVLSSRCLRRANPSSRGILPSVVCLSVIEKAQKRRPTPDVGCSAAKIFSLLLTTFCSLTDPFGFSYLRNRKTYQPTTNPRPYPPYRSYRTAATTNPQGRYMYDLCHYSQCHRLIRTYDRGVQIFKKSRRQKVTRKQFPC